MVFSFSLFSLSLFSSLFGISKARLLANLHVILLHLFNRKDLFHLNVFTTHCRNFLRTNGDQLREIQLQLRTSVGIENQKSNTSKFTGITMHQLYTVYTTGLKISFVQSDNFEFDVHVSFL